MKLKWWHVGTIFANPAVFYCVLVYFSDVHWSWLWFFISLATSILLKMYENAEMSWNTTNVYFLGIRYMQNRYDLPSQFGLQSYDDREDDESLEDRTNNELFHARLTPEQYKGIFPHGGGGNGDSHG